MLRIISNNLFKGDKVIWMIYFFLCMISLVEIYSASSSLTYTHGNHFDPMIRQAGFLFVGCHPMAGTKFSGMAYAKGDMYKGAPMVVVPPVFDDMFLLDRVKDLLSPCGFGSFHLSHADEHDKMIAFTSQLAHVVSSAYVKTPLAPKHKGFSAGSFKDMTRVARLNETMWTELFLENDDLLLAETQHLIDRLTEYRDALQDRDEGKLKSLLREGREIKEALED